MSTHKHINLICVVVLVCTILLTVLFMNGARFGIQVIPDGDAVGESEYFTYNDLNADWETTSATVIDLDALSVSGGGAYFYDRDLIISGAGLFDISGTLEDGRILVDAGGSSKVFILLNGMSVHCADDACLQVLQAKKVFLTLAEGTENTFSSGSDFSSEAEDAGRSGAIYASDNLTINGTGSLAVVGQYRHGIEANDELVITGGTITVSAPLDGFSVNDSFRMCNADIVIHTEDDGITVKNYEAGTLYQESGTLEISCSDDGIRTAGPVTLAGGSCTISCGSKGIRSETSISVTECMLRIDECATGLTAPEINAGGTVSIQATKDEIKLIVLDDVMSAAEYEELFGTPSEPEPEPVQYTAETWRGLSLVVLVLLAGIAIVLLYKKRFVR